MGPSIIYATLFWINSDQWRNEGRAGLGLPVYILIYFWGQVVHKGGAKLGFSGNFGSNWGKGAPNCDA